MVREERTSGKLMLLDDELSKYDTGSEEEFISGKYRLILAFSTYNDLVSTTRNLNLLRDPSNVKLKFSFTVVVPTPVLPAPSSVLHRAEK